MTGMSSLSVVDQEYAFVGNTGSSERVTNDLASFAANVHRLYKRMGKECPFSEYILIGGQSSGKSSAVERCIGFPLNIIDEKTATRCPLVVRCVRIETEVLTACLRPLYDSRCLYSSMTLKVETKYHVKMPDTLHQYQENCNGYHQICWACTDQDLSLIHI